MEATPRRGERIIEAQADISLGEAIRPAVDAHRSIATHYVLSLILNSVLGKVARDDF
jgi:hypothetical protein